MSLTPTIQPPYKNYLLDRKLVSIHTEDRDITKYPNNNNFAVELPEDMINIQSMRLVQIDLPRNQYTFTNDNQNTKLAFDVRPDISSSSISPQSEKSILQNKYDQTVPGNLYEIEIDEGFYTPQELANEIQTKMNVIVQDYAISQGVLTTDASFNYNHFEILYDKPKDKVIFSNDRDEFTIYFNYEHTYNNICIGQKTAFTLPIYWGLGYYLGFERDAYTSTAYNEFYLEWYPSASQAPKTPTPQITASSDSSTNQVYVVETPHILKIEGDRNIYMEIDRYNNMDELEPYSVNTKSMYNNDYAGKVNSAFVKIPLPQNSFTHVFDSLNNFLFSTNQFRTPLEKIRRLQFRFRYHDGRLVDFKNEPFSFTLEFNRLFEEQLQNQDIYIRKPEFYRQL